MRLTILEICDAIAAALNGNDFGGVTIQAKRSYRSVIEPESAEFASAFVVPGAVLSELESRESLRDHFRVDIGIGRKLPPSDSDSATIAAMDAMFFCVDAIRAALGGLEIVSDNDPSAVARCTAIETDPVFAPAALSEQRQFIAVLLLTYKTAGG